MSRKLAATLPILVDVEIEKTGNIAGSLRFNFEGSDPLQLHYTGSLPFSRSDPWGPFVRGSKPPPSERMTFFEQCVELLARANDGRVAPTRFRTGDEPVWKMDKACAPWLVNSGRWRFVAKGDRDDWGLVRADR